MQILPSAEQAYIPLNESGQGAATDASSFFSDLLDLQQTGTSNVLAPREEPPTREQSQKPVEREDFNALREELEELGLSEDDLNDLEEQVNAGMNWEDLTRELAQRALQAGKGDPKQLAGLEQARLLSTFNKLGFSPKQSESLVAALGRGEYQAVLGALDSKLRTMPQDTLVELTALELKTLGDNLKLTPKGKNALTTLGATADQGLNTKELRNLLSLLTQETEASTNLADRARALSDLVADVMRKADEKARGVVKADRLAQDEAGKMLDASKDDWTVATAKERLATKQDDAKADMAKELLETQLSKNDKAKDILLGADAKAASKTQPKGESRPLTDAGFRTALSGTEKNAVFDQVRSGMLRTLADGAQQLTINIKPEHLGTLSITLTTRGAEVSGIIRADTPETAHVLAERLDHLKAALQEEGVKVSSLDVETRAGGQQQGLADFSGEGGQQLFQEMQSRARNARLAALRGSGSRNAAPAPMEEVRPHNVGMSQVNVIA